MHKNPLRCVLYVLSLVCLLSFCPAALAEVCAIVPAHPPTDIDKAMLYGNYARAESLLRDALTKSPRDPNLTAALVRALLEEQKIDEAADLAQHALAAAPTSPALATALADVQYRQGAPWDSMTTLANAQKFSACYARAHLSISRLMRINSNYATAYQELTTAHLLDPSDPEIRQVWLQTLPDADQIAELKQYLADGANIDPELKRQAEFRLAFLEARQANPGHSCHLANAIESTEIPFTPMFVDPSHIHGWGLDVSFNDKKASLLFDTGASGLYISREIAAKAGLKPLLREQVGGIGDHGLQGGYTAYADSIKIGNLEFKDCLVDVSDRRSVTDEDGLIGADVFSHFLVTVDFPFRKLRLDPLPPYPGAKHDNSPASLETHDSSGSSPAQPGAQSGTGAKADATITRHDSYRAPEMKDYTHVLRIGHDLIVPAGLNGKAVHPFIIDTGATSTIISPNVAREVTKVHNNDYMTVTGVSGRVNRVYSADKIVIRFGSLRQELDGITSFDNSNISKNIGMEIGGFIGFTTLDVLVIRIDYRDGLVDFDYEKSRGFNHF